MPTDTEVGKVFDEMEQRLKADPSKTKGMNATYAFDLAGEEPGQYHVKVNDGSTEFGQGIPENPNITIGMKSEDFVQLAHGKMDPTMAFMSGKIKIKGDMGLAMKLQNILR